jgi:hypothetical protein
MSNKQHVENGDITNIHKVEGGFNINAAQVVLNNLAIKPATTAEPVSEYISTAQAKNLMTIIKGIDLLDVEQGRESTQALMFHVMNKATGATGYKQTPADKYDVALEAIRHYVCTRKIKT